MPENIIVPKPVNVTIYETAFGFKQSICIRVSPDSCQIGDYLRELLVKKTGISISVEETSESQPRPDEILLTTTAADASFGEEGYELTVSPVAVVLRAPRPAGLFYAVQSLRQLLSQDGRSIQSASIEDWPRFQWRGVMLDVGRHLFPREFIKHLIDLLALHKLNVFHWHLTEDQGWRIESKKYPRLSEIGSWRSASPIPANRETLDGKAYGGYYSQDEVKEIVAYAASRFVTVVPEIEMPGHSVAALASYPELGCTGGPYQVRNFWGIAKDVYCAGNEQVYSFLQDVLDEVLTLFPSQFIHIGGDECPKDRWEQCPRCQNAIQKYGLKNEHELQSYFIRRIETFLNSRGRRLIGWDEILEGGLAPNASVMSWRGIDGGIYALKMGHDVVMTPTSHCYFDYYQSEDLNREPPAISGFLPLEKVYKFDPVPSECTSEEARYILGAQGNLWTEYIQTTDQAEYMLFPRTCALAEVVWSPPEERSYENFLRRLQKFLPMLKSMGVNYRQL
jgi:hexosaminidase